MTAPMVDYKIHWLKMMSVPESRAVVGRHDGINGRDRRRLREYRQLIDVVEDVKFIAGINETKITGETA